MASTEPKHITELFRLMNKYRGKPPFFEIKDWFNKSVKEIVGEIEEHTKYCDIYIPDGFCDCGAIRANQLKKDILEKLSIYPLI